MDNPTGPLDSGHGGSVHLDDVITAGGLLGRDFPLALDRPFTLSTAREAGVSSRQLTLLVEHGLLRHPLRGVYLAAQAPDTIEQRVRSVGLVMPPGAVVTDRTAAYLHGVDILERTALLTPPPVSVFSTSGSRLRREGVGSGIRTLQRRDLMEIRGVTLTTPLRTSCDLGRLLWRFDAQAAIDLYLQYGVPQEAIIEESNSARFQGYRWIRQLRTLAPLGDARAESPGESALRLHWIEAGLPPPVSQFWVYDDNGVAVYRLDLTVPELRYAAEYDGEEFHGPEQAAADEERRRWLREHRAWVIDVFRKDSVYGRRPDPTDRLRSGIRRARAQLTPWNLTPR